MKGPSLWRQFAQFGVAPLAVSVVGLRGGRWWFFNQFAPARNHYSTQTWVAGMFSVNHKSGFVPDVGCFPLVNPTPPYLLSPNQALQRTRLLRFGLGHIS
jgi:hypothetical protein